MEEDSQPQARSRHSRRLARLRAAGRGFWKKPRLRVRPGSPPGTPQVDPDAPRPVITAFAFGPDHVEEHTLADVSALPDLLASGEVVWINVEGLGDGAVLARIGQVLGLHGLLLEDVVHVDQRPKIEEYEGRLFVVARMPSAGERVETEQISMVLGPGFVVSFQEGRQGDCLKPIRDRIRNGRGRVRQEGADYLLYSLLDAIIDSYFPVLDHLGERLESIDESIMVRPSEQGLHEIHSLKQDLLTLRRSVWPLRDAVSQLARDPHPMIQDGTRIYLRDCYDHAIRVLEMVESYRELTSSMMELYLSSVSHRMNQVMKLLTTIATIFIPLTFVAGIYGMNFDPDASPWNMPELRWTLGYPACLGTMAILALGMLWLFRRRGWM